MVDVGASFSFSIPLGRQIVNSEANDTIYSNFSVSQTIRSDDPVDKSYDMVFTDIEDDPAIPGQMYGLPNNNNDQKRFMSGE